MLNQSCKRYFSLDFIKGVETKDKCFQDRLWTVISAIDDFMDTEEEIKELHKLLEAEHSYYSSANLVYDKSFFCGEVDENAFVAMLSEDLNSLFANTLPYNENKPICTATHIIIAMHIPEKLSQKAIDAIHMNIVFNRMKVSVNLPKLTLLVNTSSGKAGSDCYIVALT